MAQRRTSSAKKLTAADIAHSMKAAAVDRFGPASALTLHDVSVPTPEPYEVLIAIHTAGIGSWDASIRDGSWRKPGRPAFPLVPGVDGAGIVAAAGARVTRVRVGDRVYAYEFGNRQGGFYAEFAVVARDMSVVCRTASTCAPPAIESFRFAHTALANWPSSRRYCTQSDVDLTRLPALGNNKFQCGGFDIYVSAVNLRGTLRSASIAVSPSDTPEDVTNVSFDSLPREPRVVREKPGEARVAMGRNGTTFVLSIAPPLIGAAASNLNSEIVGTWFWGNLASGAAAAGITRIFRPDGRYESFSSVGNRRTGTFQVRGNRLTVQHEDGARDRFECDGRLRGPRLELKNCSAPADGLYDRQR